VIAYTAVMLLIHVTSWKLLQLWSGPGDSWAKRWFSAQAALRVEAVYWLLILVSWPFWPSAGWKAVVVVFAVIHLGAWLVGELRTLRVGGLPGPPRNAHRFIVAFDLVEAGALVAIAWFAVMHVLTVG
jgi:hypothetical protein